MSDAPATIRIIVVEDNDLTRTGTVTLLRTQVDFAVVGEAEDGLQGMELHRQLRPDLAIVDLRMPRFDGVQLTAALVKEIPSARVLVLTHYEGDESVYQALKAGALGYVTKDVRRQELFEAVRAVARGQRYLPSALAGKLVDRAIQPGLSRREREVLELVARGSSNREIAAALSLSDKTITMYVSSILFKLGVKSRTEAVAVARTRGFLPS